MEERVHTNGSRNGSDTTAGRDTTGDQPAPSSDTRPMINMKTWCTEHGKQMHQCFYNHHKPQTESKLVLPCRHLVDRPVRTPARVECGCGKVWKMTLEASGRAWDAQEITSGKG